MEGPQEIPLPEQVEMIIERICHERSQPPVKNYARSYLAAIGEKASIDVLTTISSSPVIKSFGGYIGFLVRENYPNEASAVNFAYNFQRSPQRSPSTSPAYHSPQNKNGENSQGQIAMYPVKYPSSSRVRAVPQTTQGQLLYKDETEERTSPQKPNRQLQVSNEISETTRSLLQILNELEFRRLFLVLSYIGREKLESVMTLDEANGILSMKDRPMTDFESKIWDSYGRNFYEKSDRSRYSDWDCGKTHSYNCYVNQDGSLQLKGPYLSVPKNHLQRSLGDHNVLSVKFLGDGMCGTDKEGILVGLRRFRFFVFKDEHKRKKKTSMKEEKKSNDSGLKCYFVEFSGKKISEVRRLFMHIHTVSSTEKSMARLSLMLSKTITLQVDLDSVEIETIKDIPFLDEHDSVICDEDGKPLLHTDGTGYISENLAMQCPKDLWRAKYMKDDDFQKFRDFEDVSCPQKQTKVGNTEPPLLMQVRLFYNGCAVKGTLLVNKKLEPGKIQIRPSMIKVETDPALPVGHTFNSLEIVAVSHKPGRTFLSKYLIALLTYGGVPGDFFLNLVTNSLEDAQNVYSNRIAALRVASNHEGLDDGFMAQRMLSSGIPLHEPYLTHCLSRLVKDEKTKLKTGKIPISESFYVMGTADPTGILENNQVCIIHESGPISGKVLVYRNPGLHFGDIHILDAVYVEELLEVVGNAKYGIFFSTKGGRSAAYEIATGDFDGDMYWVSRNPELLTYFKASKPWSRVYSTPNSQKINPQQLSEEELEQEFIRLFLQALNPSYEMAIAADSWLAYVDQLLMSSGDSAFKMEDLLRKIFQLVDIYYDALDAPKTGKKVKVPNHLKAKMYPHYMERSPGFTYHSSSILGQIYDRVEESKTEHLPTIEISKLPCFDVEIPEKYWNMWKDRYDEYRMDMTRALASGGESKNAAADEVIKKYKQLLYDAPSMEESAKKTEEIEMEALAIYHVTYDFARRRNDIGKCKFVWNVAGSALCNLHARKMAGPNERPIVILSSLLRDILR